MKNVFVLFADGFEEIEAIAPVDILRRAGANVVTVSITDNIMVSSARKLAIVADAVFSETDFSNADMIVLPGGMPGSKNLDESKNVQKLVLDLFSKGKFIAAICAAPMVLGHLGLLKGKRATCYPGNEPDLVGATITDQPFVIDCNIITGQAAGSSVKFSLALVEVLFGKEKAIEIGKKMLV
jgi:4-methyl-5(b-hydroxyethyl)-thiazole monophosphate biosynthesis